MLKWIFGADTGPFRRGLNEMRSETQAFAGSLKGMLAGALGIATVISAFREMMVAMDRVQKLGQRFGETAETIQKISHAADLAGADIEMLAKGITKVTQNADAAAKGSGSMAAAFARAGIDAAAFVNLSMEDKVLALAGALEQGKGPGENLAMMMELLGKNGAEMIPFLIQGQEELRKQFQDTAKVSQNTIDSIAKVNDAITAMKQKSQVAMASVIDGLKIWGAHIEYGLNKAFGNDMADAQLEKRLSAALDPQEKPDTVDDAAAKVAKLLAIEEDRKKLALDVAKLEEEARQRQLSLAEKILEAEQHRAELAKKINDPFNTPTETLEAQKEKLEIEKELEALRKSSADAAAQDSAKRDSAAKKLDALKTREAEVDRDNQFNRLDDQGKLGILKDEQAALNAKAGDTSLSEKDRTEARIAAKQKQGEIDSISESLLGGLQSKLADNAKGGPVIAASALAEAGGGGPVAMFGQETREQRKVDLLTEQVALLSIIAGKGGESNVIPPST